MAKNKLLINNYKELPDFPKLEELVAQYWDDEQIFSKSLDQTAGNKEWIFYDGPPFATGLPHYGHLVASTTKDVFPRFKTMQGHYVARRWGWDCHGLPIENLVEKELELHDRPSIEKYGVDNFCKSCEDKVLLYADEWKKIIRRYGRFVDMENDYKTMDPEFMESVWWVFKALWDNGYIYQDYKPMHLCPRCSTTLSNFEVAQGYSEVTDISVYVKCKLLEPETLNLHKDTYLVLWTTTLWPLPGNFLLAVDNETSYSVFALDENPNEYLIIATELLETAIPKDKKYQVVSTLLGKDLVGKNYQSIFPYFADEREKSGAFRVVDADFVTAEDGTGIVSIAPSFGEDDFNVGKREGIPMIKTVDQNGRFVKEVTDFAGLLVKSKDDMTTDIEIVKYLAEHNLLFRKQKIKHSYPHCWRCDTPLLNYATGSYFVRTTQIKDQLMENNDQINWQPAHMKHGRFGKWLEGVRDWAISRNRFWGTPLPLWKSEDGEFLCVGSIKELEELTGEKVTDLHKPFVDKLVIKKDGKEFVRVPEVLDCWFESGSMPYASCHYPFANSESLDSFFPADFISEGQDQTRGWFYTLHVLATALTESKNPIIKVDEGATGAFKNVLVNGIVLAEDGKKMSKKLKNYPDPMEMIGKYGADSLRFYLMGSAVMKAENLNFSEKEVGDLRRKILVILWNVFAFYKNVTPDNLEIAQNWEINFESKELHSLDKWLLSQTAELVENFTDKMEKLDTPGACKHITEYVNLLSTWYLRLSRDRLKTNQNSREVFGFALYHLTLIIAPIMPFFSEIIYQNLTPFRDSVHLEKWPDVKELKQLIDLGMDEEMILLQKITEKTHQVRKDLGIKVRQPLMSLTVTLNKSLLYEADLEEILKQELNVKKVIWEKDGINEIRAQFDTTLTPELEAEGAARELIRTINGERKKQGLDSDDQWEFEVDEIPDGWKAEIEQKTNTRLIVK
ncbi:MAG: isoleucine--tRNA ligase [Pseudomonadales bacterium]|jgi:isoleucyl-tRNA synthetase|nr:isoleucine--tRNA ligase [Pseudomonadales bacterium]